MRRFLAPSLVLFGSFAFMHAGAQQSEPAAPTPHHVTWTFDPTTGAVHANVPGPIVLQGARSIPAAQLAPAAGTNYTGTIEIAFTVNLISPVPKSAGFICTVGIGLEYTVIEHPNAAQTIEDIYLADSSQSIDATVSGNTATCNFSIPYSWALPASGDGTTVSIQGISGTVDISELVTDRAVLGVTTLRTARANGAFLIGPSTIPGKDGAKISLTASTVL